MSAVSFLRALASVSLQRLQVLTTALCRITTASRSKACCVVCTTSCHRILKANIAALKAKGLDAATEVVVSGCSAGGLATFLHADAWGAALPGAKVTAMPDSGFFLDYNATAAGGRMGYGQLMRWVCSAMNSTGGLPAACVAANPSDPCKCIFAEHVVATAKVPLL